MTKLESPAGHERNRDAIVALVGRVLPGPAVVLEVGAGNGGESVAYARALPWLTWLPSDADGKKVESIAEWRAEAALANLRGPVILDVKSEPWAVPAIGAIVAVHLVCGAPWPVTVGLLAGAARHLPLHGPLVCIAEGNRWGDRSLADAVKVAETRGLVLEEELEVARDQVAAVWRRRT